MFIRFLAAYLAVGVLGPVFRFLVVACTVLLAVSAPAELWRAYVDPQPSPALLAGLTVGTFALFLGWAMTIAVRRAIRRRRQREAMAILRAMSDAVLFGVRDAVGR